jgi:hypothetical protein
VRELRLYDRPAVSERAFCADLCVLEVIETAVSGIYILFPRVILEEQPREGLGDSAVLAWTPTPNLGLAQFVSALDSMANLRLVQIAALCHSHRNGKWTLEHTIKDFRGRACMESS